MRYVFTLVVLAMLGCGRQKDKSAGAAATSTATEAAPATATGTSVATSNPDAALIDALPLVFADVASLPKCDATAKARLSYPKKEAVFMVCDGTAWQATDLSANPAVCKAPPDESTITKLVKGVSKATVQRILGQPTAVESNLLLVTWHYDGTLFCSGPFCYVTFDIGSGKLSGTYSIKPDYIDLTAF